MLYFFLFESEVAIASLLLLSEFELQVNCCCSARHRKGLLYLGAGLLLARTELFGSFSFSVEDSNHEDLLFIAPIILHTRLTLQEKLPLPLPSSPFRHKSLSVVSSHLLKHGVTTVRSCFDVSTCQIGVFVNDFVFSGFFWNLFFYLLNDLNLYIFSLIPST